MRINRVNNNFEKTALLVIDQQVQFCAMENGDGNHQTERVSSRIAELQPYLSNIVPETYFIYSEFYKSDKNPDFYKIDPEQISRHKVVRKVRNSAFKDYGPHPYIKDSKVSIEGSFAQQLRDMGIKELLICGFNLHACVAETALDACQRGFQVTILSDLVENNKMSRDEIGTLEARNRIRDMHRHGIAFIQSKKIM